MDEVPEIIGSYWTLAGDTTPPPAEGRQWSPFDIEERVGMAAHIGFDGLGFWHADLEHVAREHALPELGEMLEDAGIEYVELEFVEYGFMEPDHDRHAEAEARIEFLLYAADVLDAHHVKVGNIEGLELPLDRVVEHVADLAERAAAVDTLVGLEVVAADGNIQTLAEAIGVVEEVANAGLILDTWHVVKKDIPYDDLRAVPVGELVGVELNDGYLETDMDPDEETTGYRKLPGEGEFDVVGFVEVLREAGYDGPWGVEVLSKELRGLPMEELYTRTYDRTIEVLRRARAATN